MKWHNALSDEMKITDLEWRVVIQGQYSRLS